MNDIRGQFGEAQQQMLQDKILLDTIEMIGIIHDRKTGPLAEENIQGFLQRNPEVAGQINQLHSQIQASGSSPLDNKALRTNLIALITGYDLINPATWVVRDFLPIDVRRDNFGDSFNSAIRSKDYKFREAWRVISHMQASPFPPVPQVSASPITAMAAAAD